jgi:hypothetical protein
LLDNGSREFHHWASESGKISVAEITRRPVSLLEELRAGSGFEAGLLTTFNAYLPFLEEVVLPRLRAADCHYLIVLMDGAQLAAELIDKSRRPRAAGRRYGLLPIARGGVFHPKVGLLVGPKKARVIVGSHNVTISGFIHNREVTNIIDVEGAGDRAGAQAVIEVLEFCTAWANKLPSPLQRAVEDFSKLCRPYLGPVPEGGEINVVGSRPEGASLWERVRRLLPNPATRVTVLAPFFDDNLSFLSKVYEDLNPKELLVAIDPETACFPGNLKKLPQGLRVVGADKITPGKRRGYLHAKAMLIENESERVLLTGSANPTAAAWLSPPNTRNAEIVLIRRLPAGSADDVGLGDLGSEHDVSPVVLAKLRSRPERPGTLGGLAPLIGVCQGANIRIEGNFRSIGPVVVRDGAGIELSSTSRGDDAQIVVEVADRAHDATSIEAMLDGELRYGFVHHTDLLREAAVSSSQRRVREALSGLNGDPSQLENLLRLVEKVIFDAPAVEAGVRRKGTPDRGSEDAHANESTVARVDSIRKDSAKQRQHLATGDLGLLLDYLMRKLWQSLTHEPPFDFRPETELIDSEDEEPPPQPPTDADVAEAWHRKSRTLLRRLGRRIKEGTDAPQIIVETAAVLGVLEAVRRVEDQERWRALRAKFVDREEATVFILEAVPRLLKPGVGLLDISTKKAGAPFSEQQGVIEWVTWLAWLTGFGPSEIWVDEDAEESDVAADAAERLARACLIGVQADHANTARIVELLEESPFPGTDPREWLESLQRLGAAYNNPVRSSVLRRAPQAGDLTITQKSGVPYVVRCVRGDKADLIDFDRENETATFLVNSLRVLDSGVTPKPGPRPLSRRQTLSPTLLGCPRARHPPAAATLRCG